MASRDNLPDTLKRLRLFGLLARIDEVRNKPWLEEVLAIELEEEDATKRLAAYVRAHLLCIDEVGYLSYDARHADLLFEVVTRRYTSRRSSRSTARATGSARPRRGSETALSRGSAGRTAQRRPDLREGADDRLAASASYALLVIAAGLVAGA